MKKIIAIALTCLISFSAFAERVSKTYLVKTDFYSVNNGAKTLLSSLTENISNNRERKLSFFSREDNNKPFSLEDGVVITAMIGDFGEYNIMDFWGNSPFVDDKGLLRLESSFKARIVLKNEQSEYEKYFPFEMKDKKYLIKMTAIRVNNVEPKESKGFLRISNIVVKDSECGSDGLVANTKDKIEVSCSDGKWK